jgi:hypothetical protein
MKVYTRNLLIASGIDVGAFIVVVVIALLMDVGVSLTGDGGPDSGIFIATVALTALVSWLVYGVFYALERHVANNDVNARFLGLAPRIITALIAVVLVALVLFLCMNWVSDDGEEQSILALNQALLGVVLAVFVAVSIANALVLKPRP